MGVQQINVLLVGAIVKISNIQGEPKVGIQYRVNYCIPTVYLLFALPL